MSIKSSTNLVGFIVIQIRFIENKPTNFPVFDHCISFLVQPPFLLDIFFVQHNLKILNPCVQQNQVQPEIRALGSNFRLNLILLYTWFNVPIFFSLRNLVAWRVGLPWQEQEWARPVILYIYLPLLLDPAAPSHNNLSNPESHSSKHSFPSNHPQQARNLEALRPITINLHVHVTISKAWFLPPFCAILTFAFSNRIAPMGIGS